MPGVRILLNSGQVAEYSPDVAEMIIAKGQGRPESADEAAARVTRSQRVAEIESLPGGGAGGEFLTKFGDAASAGLAPLIRRGLYGRDERVTEKLRAEEHEAAGTLGKIAGGFVGGTVGPAGIAGRVAKGAVAARGAGVAKSIGAEAGVATGIEVFGDSLTDQLTSTDPITVTGILSAVGSGLVWGAGGGALGFGGGKFLERLAGSAGLSGEARQTLDDAWDAYAQRAQSAAERLDESAATAQLGIDADAAEKISEIERMRDAAPAMARFLGPQGRFAQGTPRARAGADKTLSDELFQPRTLLDVEPQSPRVVGRAASGEVQPGPASAGPLARRGDGRLAVGTEPGADTLPPGDPTGIMPDAVLPAQRAGLPDPSTIPPIDAEAVEYPSTLLDMEAPGPRGLPDAGPAGLLPEPAPVREGPITLRLNRLESSGEVIPLPGEVAETAAAAADDIPTYRQYDGSPANGSNFVAQSEDARAAVKERARARKRGDIPDSPREPFTLPDGRVIYAKKTLSDELHPERADLFRESQFELDEMMTEAEELARRAEAADAMGNPIDLDAGARRVAEETLEAGAPPSQAALVTQEWIDARKAAGAAARSGDEFEAALGAVPNPRIANARPDVIDLPPEMADELAAMDDARRIAREPEPRPGIGRDRDAIDLPEDIAGDLSAARRAEDIRAGRPVDDALDEAEDAIRPGLTPDAARIDAHFIRAQERIRAAQTARTEDLAKSWTHAKEQLAALHIAGSGRPWEMPADRAVEYLRSWDRARAALGAFDSAAASKLVDDLGPFAPPSHPGLEGLAEALGKVDREALAAKYGIAPEELPHDVTLLALREWADARKGAPGVFRRWQRAAEEAASAAAEQKKGTGAKVMDRLGRRLLSIAGIGAAHAAGIQGLPGWLVGVSVGQAASDALPRFGAASARAGAMKAAIYDRIAGILEKGYSAAAGPAPRLTGSWMAQLRRLAATEGSMIGGPIAKYVPALGAAVEGAWDKRKEYLLQHAPRSPFPEGTAADEAWQPSPAERLAFEHRAAAAEDPLWLLESAAFGRSPHPAAVDAVETLYPELFQNARLQAAIRWDILSRRPYAERVALSMALKLPLEASLDPGAVARRLAASPPPISPPGGSPAGGALPPSVAKRASREDTPANQSPE